MANKTIYPYGSGGQLPSNIGIVNDLTTGGADKALSAEQGKILAEYVFMGSGSFGDAYDKAKTTIAYFPWLLEDTDEEGNPIKKMIWHTGNGEFIDAIGAEISGQKNGLTVTTTEACDMSVNGTIFPLAVGENNFTAEELGLVNGSTVSSISNGLKFYTSGTNTEKKTQITAIDFGWLSVSNTNNDGVMNDFTNLTSLKRCNIKLNLWNYGSFEYNKIKDVTMTGYTRDGIVGLFRGCTLLERADLSGCSITIGGNNTASRIFEGCTSLKEADVRLLKTSSTKKFERIFKNCSSLKKLTLGENFSNENMTSKSTCMNGVSGCTLFMVSSTPPVLKNCSFTNGVANDEHSVTYDWLSYISDGEEICRFDAIYVPDDAVQTYKSNTYIENGTVGNTGWSYYADIIKPMSEYVE